LLETTFTLDPDLVEAVDQHVGHARPAQQMLDRTQANESVDDLRHGIGTGQRRLRRQQPEGFTLEVLPFQRHP
jgi:hypothetical protein